MVIKVGNRTPLNKYWPDAVKRKSVYGNDLLIIDKNIWIDGVPIRIITEKKYMTPK